MPSFFRATNVQDAGSWLTPLAESLADLEGMARARSVAENDALFDGIAKAMGDLRVYLVNLQVALELDQENES